MRSRPARRLVRDVLELRDEPGGRRPHGRGARCVREIDRSQRLHVGLRHERRGGARERGRRALHGNRRRAGAVHQPEHAGGDPTGAGRCGGQRHARQRLQRRSPAPGRPQLRRSGVRARPDHQAGASRDERCASARNRLRHPGRAGAPARAPPQGAALAGHGAARRGRDRGGARVGEAEAACTAQRLTHGAIPPGHQDRACPSRRSHPAEAVAPRPPLPAPVAAQRPPRARERLRCWPPTRPATATSGAATSVSAVSGRD